MEFRKKFGCGFVKWTNKEGFEQHEEKSNRADDGAAIAVRGKRLCPGGYSGADDQRYPQDRAADL